jgi:CheY-like chemotaxis protein
MAHAQGLKALVALRGDAALSLAVEFKPAAITLDIGLPDMAGWTILDRLKHDVRTSQIPVHVISAEDQHSRSMALGAMTFVQKATGKDDLKTLFGLIRAAAEPRMKTLIVVSADHEFRQRVQDTVAGPDIRIIEYHSGGTFLDVLDREKFDAVVFDAAIADVSAVSLIQDLQRSVPTPTPPAIVFSTAQLDPMQLRNVAKLARQTSVRYVSSPEMLLKETIWQMHRDESILSSSQQTLLENAREHDPVLAGKTVLVVDDDLRNIFALTSLLEHHDIQVLHAENGRAGIDILEQNPLVDAVLMDIMMPEMDGYETIAAIRRFEQFQDLPIVALTAKAMKGDREKCIQAGASDYVAKPVDLEQLFSVLRVLISTRAETRLAIGGEEDVTLPSPARGMLGPLEDDRHRINPGDAVLLIIEDDPIFARILAGMAQERGLKALVATQGKAAIALAREFNPAAITLDISLPDMAGWSLLDRFKHDQTTRHIPVHIISGDEDRRRGLALGAMTYVQKASDEGKLSSTFGLISEAARVRAKKILLVAPPESTAPAVVAAKDVQITHVHSRLEALDVVASQYLDGVIVETPLGEEKINRLIGEISSAAPDPLPIIVFGAEGMDLASSVPSASIVRYVGNCARLLDESVSLWHRHEGNLSDDQRELLEQARTVDPKLVGRKVLVVDDDVRNIFALTSILRHHQIEVVDASNGKDCLRALAQVENIDIILMDIMMPEMDGYETIRAIRSDRRFAGIPIVALTARAMKGDREKCLEAGATDYVAKPVDLDELFSVLRVCVDVSARPKTNPKSRSTPRKKGAHVRPE